MLMTVQKSVVGQKGHTWFPGNVVNVLSYTVEEGGTHYVGIQGITLALKIESDVIPASHLSPSWVVGNQELALSELGKITGMGREALIKAARDQRLMARKTGDMWLSSSNALQEAWSRRTVRRPKGHAVPLKKRRRRRTKK